MNTITQNTKITSTDINTLITECNNKLSLSGGNVNGDFIFPTGRISCQGANNEFLIFANETGELNGSVIAMRTENASVPYSFLIRAGRFDQNPHSIIEFRPDGTFTHNNNPIITSAGGVMTGAIQFGGAVRNVAAADTTGEVTLCGGTAWNTGAFIAVHGKDHVGLEGVVDISARHPDTDVVCQLFLRPGEMPLANGSPVLTAAGGTMTGTLFFSNANIYSDNDSSVFTLHGGPTWDKCPKLRFFGSNYSDANLRGSAQLDAFSNGQSSYFSFAPNGQASINGSQVLTSAHGMLMNWGNVSAGTVSGGSFTLPSGGTWAYIIVRGQYDGNAAKAGTAAGGTTVNTNDNGDHAFFAIRIS